MDKIRQGASLLGKHPVRFQYIQNTLCALKRIISRYIMDVLLSLADDFWKIV